jgi:hypothetical protein
MPPQTLPKSNKKQFAEEEVRDDEDEEVCLFSAENDSSEHISLPVDNDAKPQMNRIKSDT